MDDSHLNYNVKHDLDELKKRLETGMVVKGKILDCPREDRYILRVWGYNIYTESRKKFDVHDEIKLTVKAIEPNLVFDMKKIENFVASDNHQTDILI